MRTAKIGPDLRLHHSRDLRRNDGENVAQTSRNVGFLCLHVVLFFGSFSFVLPVLYPLTVFSKSKSSSSFTSKHGQYI